MNAFALATDTLFGDQNLALDALWRAGGAGPGVAIRAIRRSPDRALEFGDGRFVTDSVLIDIRVSEVAALAAGDTVEITGTIYEVRGAPVRNTDRMIWTAEVREP